MIRQVIVILWLFAVFSDCLGTFLIWFYLRKKANGAIARLRQQQLSIAFRACLAFWGLIIFRPPSQTHWAYIALVLIGFVAQIACTWRFLFYITGWLDENWLGVLHQKTLGSMLKRKPKPLKDLERIILSALVDEGSESYGAPIHAAVEEATGGFVAIGSVYAILDELERRGFVISRMGESTPERGDRPKKYFKITEAGVAALKPSPPA